MSTGSAPDDERSTCSVCLEPYKGRNPKLLPCFHTFCLPCLKDLEVHHMVSADSKGCEEDGSKKPLTFPCPTCRADIIVPTGGVTQFQSNFYLNLETLTCDVCGEGKEAKYSCSDCGQNMCAKCQRCHDKFTSNHQVQPLAPYLQHSSEMSLNPDLERKREEQLSVLEAALATMKEEENKLQRERQAVADVISRRADALRALVTQAEERSQKALAGVADRMEKHIKESIGTLRQKHSKIFRLLPQEDTKGQANLMLKNALLSDADFQYYHQRCSKDRQTKKVLHQFKDCAIDIHIVEAYIGKVCGDDEPVGETETRLVSNETDAADSLAHDLTVKPQPSEKLKLTDDAAEIRDTLETLETTPDNECKHSDKKYIKSIQDENARLQMDVAALKENISTIQQSMITSKDISSIQKDMAGLQEKLTGDITMLQKSIIGIQEGCSDHSTEIKKIHCDTSKDISSILKDMAGLQEKLTCDFAMLQKNITVIQEGYSDHSTEIKKIQCDIQNLVKDLKTFKEKSCSMVAFHAEVNEDIELTMEWKPLILYDDVYNLGQAYDTETGVFTAPVAGTYFFMARTLRQNGLGCCSIAISVQGCNYTSSYSHDGELQAGVGCTVHLVYRLTRGQKVWLEAFGDSELVDFATCFSGMLVRPEV
ncbi:uncharacterized protein LOC112566674 isoform X3 [Pomacea canaliculata]|uniref:uncharacterized protein LOC112566674 isoform X3 n=1 Tax=Pomacea canaliculata TaxID=400727 RepID=UPI000D72915E|nr:uncharacterized protein LOC112566674 isoform X3 [Pomacea canaliculata]